MVNLDFNNKKLFLTTVSRIVIFYNWLMQPSANGICLFWVQSTTKDTKYISKRNTVYSILQRFQLMNILNLLFFTSRKPFSALVRLATNCIRPIYSKSPIVNIDGLDTPTKSNDNRAIWKDADLWFFQNIVWELHYCLGWVLLYWGRANVLLLLDLTV